MHRTEALQKAKWSAYPLSPHKRALKKAYYLYLTISRFFMVSVLSYYAHFLLKNAYTRHLSISPHLSMYLSAAILCPQIHDGT